MRVKKIPALREKSGDWQRLTLVNGLAATAIEMNAETWSGAIVCRRTAMVVWTMGTHGDHTSAINWMAAAIVVGNVGFDVGWSAAGAMVFDIGAAAVVRASVCRCGAEGGDDAESEKSN